MPFMQKAVQKQCKSKGGLRRHIFSKHPELSEDHPANSITENESTHENIHQKTIELSDVELLVKETSSGLASNKCYPENFAEELGNVKFENWSNEVKNNLLVKIREVSKCLGKVQPNAEKFYSNFCSSVVSKCSKYFLDFSQNEGTLFATKLANSLLTFLKKPTSIVGIETEIPEQSFSKTLSLREMAGLQDSGYVYCNLHHKIRGSSEWKTTSYQQSLSISEAAKLEEVSRSQELVSCLNCGGL